MAKRSTLLKLADKIIHDLPFCRDEWNPEMVADQISTGIAPLVEALEKIEGGLVPPDFLKNIENETKASFQERLNEWLQKTAREALSRFTPKED